MSKHGKRLCYLIAVILCAASLSAFAQTNVLRNGSFDDGLEGWTVSREFGYLNLHSLEDTSCIYLSASNFPRPVTVVYQNLNVTGIASKTFALSMKLRGSNTQDEPVLAVAVEYVDVGGTIHHDDILCPNTTELHWNLWNEFHAGYTFPSDACKLVKLTISKLLDNGNWGIGIDDIAFSGEDVRADPVPEIASIDPVRGPYGTVATIRGTNFGDSASGTGQVVTTAGPGSARIISWTDDTIVARVEDPVRSGWLTVIADSVESNGEFYFRVISPYYRIRCVTPHIHAVRGQKLQFVIGIDGFNGFASESGIDFRVPEAPEGVVTISPTPVKNDGGTLVTVDTSLLDTGSYTWHLVSEEPNSAPQSVPFSFRLTTVTNIYFADYDTGEPIDVLNVTQQDYIRYRIGIECSDGGSFPWDSPRTYRTEDPSKLCVCTESGGYVYALENGTTNLIITTADGFSKTLPVNISLTASPQVTGLNLSPRSIFNNGGQLIAADAVGTHPLNVWWSDDYFDTFTDYTLHYWDDGKRVAFTGCVEEGIEPKEYYFTAFCNDNNGMRVSRMAPLTVQNDPSRGLIECYTYYTGPRPSDEPPSIDTRFELFDSAGNKLAERQYPYWQNMRHGRFWYLEPGAYRLKFAESDYANEYVRIPDLWYPNATSLANARDVEVTAGQTVDDIYFFIPQRRPYVHATEPEPGETDVWYNEDIYIYMVGNIDPRSVNTTSVTIRDSSGRLVPMVKDQYSRFKPVQPLAKLTTYTVTVSTDVMDIYGFPMDQEYSWSFTTRSDLIGHIRTLPDDTDVYLPSKILYYGVPAGDGHVDCYVEEPDRSSGILVKGLEPSPVGLLLPPREATVSGRLSTLANGKRYIIGSVNFSFTDYADLKPLGANIKTIKSPMMDGMLVTTWGSVMPGTITANSFSVSDGSDADGVKVISISGSVNVNEGDFVVVTGAAGYDGERVIYKD